MLDLTTDNLLPSLLDERAALKAGIDANQKRLKEIDAEIASKLAGSEEAITSGWKITHKIQIRKEHVVKETVFTVLRATRIEDPALAA
jgi:predicted phage-related endonuclease